jgi:ABC-type transporter Mla MlaB component
MNMTEEFQKDCGRMTLKGELTLENIRPLYENMKDMLEKAKHLVVDVSEASDADLCLLQLLCSAHRTAMKTGKTLAFAEIIPDVVQKAMADNGYTGQSRCSLDVNHTCLWAKR